MRFLRVLTGSIVLGFVILATASASELKINVIDPESAAVSRARVELYVKETTTPVAIETTSPEGMATTYRAGVANCGRDGDPKSGPQ